MRISYKERQLQIEPETEFEGDVLKHFDNTTCFLKRGLSPKEIVGIVIRQKEESEKNIPNKQTITE